MLLGNAEQGLLFLFNEIAPATTQNEKKKGERKQNGDPKLGSAGTQEKKKKEWWLNKKKK